MSTLSELAKEDWRFYVDDMAGEAQILKPNPSLRGAFIGPLATIQLKYETEDDDGDSEWFVDGEDGRNLFAIAALPGLARLVRNILEGRDPQEVYEEAQDIQDAIDNRGETVHEGVWGVSY